MPEPVFTQGKDFFQFAIAVREFFFCINHFELVFQVSKVNVFYHFFLKPVERGDTLTLGTLDHFIHLKLIGLIRIFRKNLNIEC